MRVLSEALKVLRKRNVTEEQLYTNRLALLRAIKLDLQQQVDQAAEALFRRKLEEGDISLCLVASPDQDLNWELAKTLEIDVSDEDRPLRRRDGTPLQKSLLETVYQRDFNTLERDTAWYLDPSESVYWWHRIAVNQRSYSLQGWQRHKVFPDFLACLYSTEEGKFHFTLLETKGEHLKGNDDTEYKRKLFELLTGHAETALRDGEMELITEPQSITFIILMGDSLREDLAKVGIG
jgi:type III restriction enzyme